MSNEFSIISGEKFQYLCDCYLADEWTFSPLSHIYNNTLYKDKILNEKNFENDELFLKSNIIFVYTWWFYRNESNVNNRVNIKRYSKDETINAINLFINNLKKKTEPFKLVFHNSDSTVDEKFFSIFKETKCTKIFAQNVNVVDSRIQYIPIGLANSKWPHGNKKLFNSIISNNIEKTNEIFLNFSIQTNRSKREPCFNKLKNKITVFKNSNQKIYWEKLASCKFCICPEGNGFDTHRLWECLYLKTIPICIENTFSRIISNDFPLFLIKDWDELNIDDIYEKYDSYINQLDSSKLDFSYWKNIILEA